MGKAECGQAVERGYVEAMKTTVSIGSQNYRYMRENQTFYIDKTMLIKEWWENEDIVTLITRPRRFGKTLNLSMMESFFSKKYEGRGDLFEGLAIWNEEQYQEMQGTWPVISLSFAAIKGTTYRTTREGLITVLQKLYESQDYLLEGNVLNEMEKKNYYTLGQYVDDYKDAKQEISDNTIIWAVNTLMSYMMRYYGKKVIVFLDEYDTPLQEAYVHGYWMELTALIRGMFNATFKTNESLYRGLLTGITRVSKESIFSDLNNLEVVTTTSEKYRSSFGFTEKEVEDALELFGLSDQMDRVRNWYDGFRFGSQKDIYNPWSITNYLSAKKFDTYWANSSSNSLVSKLIREGNSDIKIAMEDLLAGREIKTVIDEEIIFDQLDGSNEAIWSLLLASGYLRVVSVLEINDIANVEAEEETDPVYCLALTNLEVRKAFRKMIQSWFGRSEVRYNDFVKALLANDVDYMNQYMSTMAACVFSSFDVGKHPSKQTEPERFYHGFVLGLIVDAKLDYIITSNRESGLGRYDVVMEPRKGEGDAYVFEFKVKNPASESTLEETVQNALGQIKQKNYDAILKERGIPVNRIHHYGFAFEGKKVLIGTDDLYSGCCSVQGGGTV